MPLNRISFALSFFVLLASSLVSWPSCSKTPEPPQTSGPPMRIARYNWPGQYWKEIARQKGWFREAGLEVELVDTNQDYYKSLSDMVEGKMDSNSFTAFDMVRFNLQGADLVAVVSADISFGMDAIVAGNEIEDIAGLRGKKIAVAEGTYSEYLLDVVLRKGGLAPDEVDKVDLITESSVDPFIEGTVDAIVTWEPLATEAKEKGQGPPPMLD